MKKNIVALWQRMVYKQALWANTERDETINYELCTKPKYSQRTPANIALKHRALVANSFVRANAVWHQHPPSTDGEEKQISDKEIYITLYLSQEGLLGGDTLSILPRRTVSDFHTLIVARFQHSFPSRATECFSQGRFGLKCLAKGYFSSCCGRDGDHFLPTFSHPVSSTAA